MTDRMLSRLMGGTVVALIAILAGGSLMLGYLGVTELFAARTESGGCAILASAAPAAATVKLVRLWNALTPR